MDFYGLIGFPLSHSFSKKYFTEKFINEGIKDSEYSLFPLETINDLSVLLDSSEELRGLNVTIPYKEQVLPFLDEIDEAAKGVGAVNTIKISNGKLKGYNTDIYGFEYSLRAFFKRVRQEKKLLKNPELIQPLLGIGLSATEFERMDFSHIKALILGTGGAAKAIAYILKKLKISYKYVSRKPKEDQIGYNDISKEIIQTHQLIVNTTPLGMSPKIDTCPDLPYEYMGSEHYLYDLVYNPAVTEFLNRGKRKGAAIQNGLEMLHLQAEKSWEIWMED